MWRLNPRAREQFAVMGPWALLLMGVVSVTCALTSYGLWNGRRFGFILGITMLTVSLLGDLANAVLGIEPRAWAGVPIAAALLVLLATGRAKAFFSTPG
jgi:ABC-type multidrug transport system permease subunit